MGRTWIRVERGMLTDVKLLGKPGWYGLLWLALLCQADEGVLQGVTSEDLLTLMRMETIAPGDLEQALAYFEKRGMIRRGAREGDAPQTIVVVNYFKHQPKDVTGAERQARFKERQVTPGNGVVTPGNTQTDIRTNIRTHEQTKEEAPDEPSPAPHSACGLCDFLSKAWPAEFADRGRAAMLHSTWRDAYPGVDLLHHAKKAKSFELSNPTRKKVNHARFLDNWFKSEQDKGPNAAGGYTARTPYVNENPGAERRPAVPSAASTKEMLDRKLAVPASTPEQRAEFLKNLKSGPPKNDGGTE